MTSCLSSFLNNLEETQPIDVECVFVLVGSNVMGLVLFMGERKLRFFSF